MPSTESGQDDTSNDQTEWIDYRPDSSPTLYDSVVIQLPIAYQDGRSSFGGKVYRKYLFTDKAEGLKSGSLVCDYLGRHGRVKILKKTDQLYWTALVSPIPEEKLPSVLCAIEDDDPFAF